ncbi:MAG: hypothetical protein A2W47_04330 [Gammaproteobacteria bacterium RIFCSPHIGHO2_12_38_15]|nr:MAG: hypothetical protein A2W47_04330 [Gammaproteobacteria bacterium RIFCSPHIGHO2_12_38_15]
MDIIEKRIKEKQKRIDAAIASREKSIAYFNSLNAAISLLAATIKEGTILDPKAFIQEWRDTFYQLWQEWYLENMLAIPRPEAKRTPTDILETIEAAEAANHRTRTEEEREAGELFDINLNQ